MKLTVKAIVLSVVFVQGCITNPTGTDSHSIVNVAESKSMPVKALTSMHESLRCMDNLFYNNPPKIPLTLVTQGVRSESANFYLGSSEIKEIVYSAYSNLTEKSDAFSFVDFDSAQYDINSARDVIRNEDPTINRDGVLKPSHVLRVSITQTDENVINQSSGVGLSLPSLPGGFALPSIGYQQGEKVTLITVDMNLVDFKTRKIISKANSKNSLAIRRSGVNYGIDSSKKRLPSNGSQVLTQGSVGDTPFSVIETATNGGGYLLGSLKLSYGIEKNESVSQALRKLIEIGLMEVVGKYLNSSYWNCLPGADDKRQLFSAPVQKIDSNSQGVTPVAPFMELDKNSYNINDKVKVKISSLVNQYVNCYYQDSQGVVRRVIPNPKSSLKIFRKGESRELGGKDGGQIIIDSDDKAEKMLCIATIGDVEVLLPPRMRAQGMEALPVRSLDEIENAYSSIEPVGISTRNLLIGTSNALRGSQRNDGSSSVGAQGVISESDHLNKH